MSPANTYEGRTIEEALRAAQNDLGDGVQIVDASRERTGGLFGFFARERYRVVASAGPMHPPEPADADFADVLRTMADGVTDVVVGERLVYEAAQLAAFSEEAPPDLVARLGELEGRVESIRLHGRKPAA